MQAISARKHRRWAWIVGLIAFYLAGIAVRYHYGLRVAVVNDSGERLYDVTVKVQRRGNNYPLGEMSPGQTRRLFVAPAGESAINLEFKDARHTSHSEVLAGYVESAYVGGTRGRIMPGLQINVVDDTFRLLYWKSWFEFL